MAVEKAPVSWRRPSLIVAIVCGIIIMSACVHGLEFIVDGVQYHLSSYETNYHNAKLDCTNAGWQLTFFETNDQYRKVRDFIKSKRDDGTITSSGLRVYVDFTATPVGGHYQFSWQNEPFDLNVWIPEYYEPDDYCSIVSSTECCGILYFNSLYAGLRDTPSACSSFQGLYLCTKTTIVPVDECALGTDNCDQICMDNATSFECHCMAGFELQSDGSSCQDINECQNITHGCAHGCINTGGSYYCECKNGFDLDADNKSCSDVDECAQGIHNCSQYCTDLPGSYSCDCWSGYTLGLDNETCHDIDECEITPPLCHHTCVNSPGSYQCECDLGFELQANNHSCSDIDECALNSPPCEQGCNNTIGSYFCTCDEGYLLLANLTNCIRDECNCSTNRRVKTTSSGTASNVTQATIDQEVAAIYARLVVDQKTLSSHIRKLNCATDDRPSSAAVGTLGIVLLSGLAVLLLVMDIHKLLFIRN